MPFLSTTDMPSDSRPLYLGFDLSTQQLKGTPMSIRITLIEPAH